MNSAELRALQAPLKQRYRSDPAAARVTSRAEAVLTPGVVAAEILAPPPAPVGLHQSTGGDGTRRCSADLMLEALAGCAGVTFMAVATAMSLELRGGRVLVEGDWDARGTLGVSREVPVGLTGVRVEFRIDTDADPVQCEKAVELAERYCVVAQTMRASVPVTVRMTRG